MTVLLTPWRGIAAVLWLVATVGVAAASAGGLPHLAGWFQLTAVGYILMLMALVWHNQPQPAAIERGASDLGFWPALALFITVLVVLFALGRFAHPWLMLALTMGLAGLWAIWHERRSITLPAVVVALGAGALCLGLNAAANLLSVYQTFYLGLVPAMFLGGALLVKRLDLTRVASAEGDWPDALRRFGWGLLLALPPALLNISLGAHSGDGWVDQLWEPLVALSPGIAEEAMARLMLLTLCWFLLAGRRGASAKTALGAAVLIAAFAHGLAHVPTAQILGPAGGTMLLAGLLFGVPMGLIFLRFGFEAAVAYHFFIDFVRFIAAYLAG